MTKKRVVNLDLAAITGSQGVNSSEWFPISQSYAGKRFLSDGSMTPS